MTTREKWVSGLQKSYSGPMSEDDVKLLRDMQAFIEFCIENGLSSILALGTIAHDVNGLLRQESGFHPKVSGYTEIMEELQSAKTD